MDRSPLSSCRSFRLRPKETQTKLLKVSPQDARPTIDASFPVGNVSVNFLKRQSRRDGGLIVDFERIDAANNPRISG